MTHLHAALNLTIVVPVIRRRLALDFVLASSLIVIAAILYGSMFIHVPVLTEVRDFLLRFGQDAKLAHVFVPTGDDYRPFSWKFFAWQQQLFGFQSELFNLVQFLLLGLCALAAYIHLRQLFGHRIVAFGVSSLWLLSLPVADAAFWQATQHDKLAFLFTILTLILTLHAIRLDGAIRVPIYVVLNLILVALAVAAKPVAFMLPIALTAQLVFLTTGKTRSGYRRTPGLMMVPAVYVALYAIAYMLATTPKWRAHTMSGNITENLLIYIRNITNIDYEGSLVLATLLFAPVGAGWMYALWHTADSLGRILVYLFVIFIASVTLLAGAAHASSYYLLLPLFAFHSSLGGLAVLLLANGSAWIRRFAAVAVTGIVVGLLANYWIAISGRLHNLGRNGQHLSNGYKIIRSLVDPEGVKSVSFYFPRKPFGYFYFFSDGTHQVIDPMIPSFIFNRSLSISINDAWGKLPYEVPGSELVAVWSDDLQLTELRLFGRTLYRSSAIPSEPLVYLPGKTLLFQRGGNGKQHQGEGWSLEENWGTWSDGAEASLLFRLHRRYDVPLELIVWGQAFVPPEHPKQTVQVLANGHLIANWTFHHGDSLDELRARIPAELLESDYLKLSFRILNPRSPESLGLSRDTRALGIMLQKLRIDLAQPGAVSSNSRLFAKLT